MRGGYIKILITGGGGFIGRGLILAIPKNHEIVCLDRGRRFPELQQIMGDNVTLIKGDVTNKELINRILRDDIQTIIHLAGSGGNNVAMNNPSNAVLTHVNGTHNLINSAAKNDVDRIIFASSICVYSTYAERNEIFNEESNLMPDDLYGALKTAAEYEIIDSQISHVILRLSNVYGEIEGFNEVRKGGAIENFIKSAHENSDITIYGTGEQQIDYVNINDVIRCMIAIIEKVEIKNEILNVGSGNLYSIKDIARIVSECSKRFYHHETNIKNVPAPEGKIWPDRLMSIDKAKTILGWEPVVSLENGICNIMENLPR